MGQTLIIDKNDFFENPSSVSHFKIGGDSGTLVSIAYQALTGGSPGLVYESTVTATAWRLYPGNWDLTWDGFAVVNRSEVSTNVSVIMKNAAGETLDERTNEALTSLPANGKGLAIISAMGFTALEKAYFVIRADKPLALIALRGSQNGTYLWPNAAVIEPE